MGFIQPNLPVVDMAEWSKGTRAQRIVPMARHIAENGFGTPLVMPVMYGINIVLYILGAWLFALSTSGVEGFSNVGVWWTEPIVFEKAVLYTMLFEVVGLGCCFGPMAGRYFPPMGSILYWLRPGTIRLPPLAQPGATDQGHQPNSVRGFALRRPTRAARRRVGVRRHRANS